jgi:hypothetical protein
VDSEPETLLPTFAGLVGPFGLNSRGIGVCNNSLVPVMSHATRGLPTTFISRGVLAQSSFEDADCFIRTVPHPLGNTFTIGAPGRVVAYECSPNKVVPYVPSSQATITYHTNHPMVNDDQVSFDNADYFANSGTRFGAVGRRMQECAKPMSWEDVKVVLSAHSSPDYPICRHAATPEQTMSNFCMIMECSPQPTLHVAPGPPCSTEFREFGF